MKTLPVYKKQQPLALGPLLSLLYDSMESYCGGSVFVNEMHGITDKEGDSADERELSRRSDVQ